MYKKLLAAVMSAALSACLLTGCSAEDIQAYLASLGISWGGSSSSSSMSTSTRSTSGSPGNPAPESPKANADDNQAPAVDPKTAPDDPMHWSMNNNTLTILNESSTLLQETVTKFLDMHPNSIITTIKLPVNVTTIKENAFGAIGGLTSINLEHVTSIGGNAFLGTKLTQVNLERAETIGSGAFLGCPLTSLSLPSATSVGTGAFAANPNLTSASLPKVTALKAGAFRSCTGLQKVYIGQKLSAIENQVFDDCTSLKVIYFAGDQNPALDNWGWKYTDSVDYKDWEQMVQSGSVQKDKTYLVYNVTSLNLDRAWPQV